MLLLNDDGLFFTDTRVDLASTKHLSSAQALANGLSDVRRSKPGYWVQMSGASMFSVPDISKWTYGEPPSEVHDDLQDTDKIVSIIRNNPARIVDNLVLDQDSSKVKTALIVGPLIYGTGEGPGNTHSIQIPEMARVTLEKGEGFRVGAGKSVWSTIHVRDLGAILSKLADAAAEGQANARNENGVYCVEGGKKVCLEVLSDETTKFADSKEAFGEIGELVAKEAHAQGLIKSADVKVSLNADEANATMPGGAIFWGTNAVSVGQRARKQLSWQPTHESLEASIPESVTIEALRRKKSVL